MLKKIMCKLNPTIENLEKELLSHRFDKNSADIIMNSEKVNINQLNNYGETLLHICLKNNKLKASKWLIENGINTNIKNKDGITAQRLAVEKGEAYIVDSLIQHTNMDINQVDKNGRSLLQDAVIMGHDKVAKHLIKHSININNVDNNNRNVSFDALAYGDNNMIDELLTDTKIDLNIVDIEGETILHNKNVLNNDELATKLLEKGANPTICDKDGNSFLVYSALRGKAGEAILDTAIRCGCDLNSTVANNNSILMEVMFAFTKISKAEQNRRKGLRNIAKKLLDNGLDIDSINNDGETVLFNTIRANDIESCAFLLENKVDVNHKNKNHETALSISILKGIHNLDIILLLLEYNANPNIRDNNSKTTLEVLNEIILHVHNIKEIANNEILNHISSTGNYMTIIKEILAITKYNFNFLDSTGNPLFFTPFLNGDIATTKLYLKSGLDINSHNKDGHTVFYEYVINIFDKGVYINEFRDNLTFLLLNKADVKATNKHGQNIFIKIALSKECNLKLFRNLVQVTKFNYFAVDNLGRTIIHSCVWSNNIELLNLVYGVCRDIQNIPDNYNILPITYAALFGHKEIVKEFLRRKSIIRSGKPISKSLKEKFQPLLKNLDNLSIDCHNKDDLRQIEILQSEVKKNMAL